MHEKQLYEYAVIRIVPRIEREEFLNVGLIMFCKQKRWLKAQFFLNKELLTILAPDADPSELESYLRAFIAIAVGEPGSEPIGGLDPASRFRWLTAVRSSVLQTSRPHPGMCNDLDKRFEKLFTDLVL